MSDCTCGGIDIGVGTMHEPGCGLPHPDEVRALEAENERLREEVERLRNTNGDHDGCVGVKHHEQHHADEDHLRALLARWLTVRTAHGRGCTAEGSDVPDVGCDCGLRDLEKATREAAGG